MPDLVRLPAEVPDGEMRIFWDRTDEGDDLHVWGPQRLRRWFLAMVAEPRFEVRPDVGLPERMRLLETSLERAPSIVEALEAKGYDPRSLVFSIRKRGMGVPPVDLPDGVRTRLEEAQIALRALREAIDAHEETKGVHVVDEDEKGRIDGALADAVAAVAGALDLASGDAGPDASARARGEP